ncbi:ABC transporter substrate-binding protein [Mobilicoccus massiliensis]|uniref:ABC transporter substrate-binding protein n=1 Tax=Mobilicoccus massiliensis TaxID=1522310 RepID=UPI0009E1B0A7|nr:ABC transporter substrate-binding protein [Mobilicoccus massiliensis]
MHAHVRPTPLRSAARVAAVVSALTLLVACAGAPPAPSDGAAATTPGASASSASFTPVDLDDCGDKVTVEEPPSELVTLNQGATEVALALGLADRMVGTAYLDDAVAPRYAEAYDSVPVLAEKYPTKEKLLATAPDFAYAAYASAFTDEGIGTRAELSGEGVGTYLSPFGCPEGTTKADPTFESGWREITEVASIFGVQDRAEKVVADQRTQLAEITKARTGDDRSIFWYDSGDKTPFVGAGGGGPQLVVDAVGATNVFGDIKDPGWADGSWEKVIAADPDVIVLADASWDTAKKKRAHLESDPTLSKLTAVQEKRFVVVPFSESTPGVRLVDGAKRLSDELAALPAS